MDQQTATLMAVIFTAVVSLASLILNSRFTLTRECTMVMWKKEVDRLTELEELAGRLIEDIGGHQDYKSISERIGTQIEQLDAMGGRLARYPEVRQAVRELRMVVGNLSMHRRDSLDDRKAREAIEPAYRILLAACDRVVGPRPS